MAGLRRPNRPPFLSTFARCGFRPFSILPAYYPTDLARCFRPFVDLLLTRGLERKKPPEREAHKLLI